ncbi:NifB/NifX family molybdenum-iron cluster-binding protein [Clostridium kluyveri]|uniref:Hydrogenase n=1 Tax=Clostridium kluyveri TaxID=1534 RepID=A0A1L5FAL3_CLOKL|nr:NifB/NifX family molybdenum-iron cluster-binding protein [Clostridium kluyveri]APM40061.1 hydrogenase [Clostridium kluyveri]UZQ49699.1 NifB/NifX family molybdenum-iron cluster-binding protein [Clostridium kluyveri]
MNYKVAVASSDGKFVNEHFRKASQFYIYKVEDGNYEFMELRKVDDIFCCEKEGHYDKILSIVKHLSGCRIVLVSQIGREAAVFLNRNGIEAFDINQSIDEALKKLIKYYSRIDKINEPCN